MSSSIISQFNVKFSNVYVEQVVYLK